MVRGIGLAVLIAAHVSRFVRSHSFDPMGGNRFSLKPNKRETRLRGGSCSNKTPKHDAGSASSHHALDKSNPKIVKLLAGLQLRREPARLPSPTGPGLGRLRRVAILWKHWRITAPRVASRDANRSELSQSSIQLRFLLRYFRA